MKEITQEDKTKAARFLYDEGFFILNSGYVYGMYVGTEDIEKWELLHKEIIECLCRYSVINNKDESQKKLNISELESMLETLIETRSIKYFKEGITLGIKAMEAVRENLSIDKQSLQMTQEIMDYVKANT